MLARISAASTILIASMAALLGQSDDAIGPRVADFRLQDYRGKEYALSDFENDKLLVVAFLGVDCPLARLYAGRLAKMAGEFADRGVRFLAIDSNAQDAVTEMAAYARVHGIEFPFLKDPGNRVADQFGVRRNPEVFLLDGERTIRYRGRVDDQYGIGYQRTAAGREDLRIAITELLAGRPVGQPETEAVGCLIGRVREPDPTAEVTYSNQVARLLNRRCVECHRAGEIAPFALTTYEEAAGWADMIQEVVDKGRMPPWHANPDHGTFRDDRRLSDGERDLIRAWVAAGAPQGDPAELPPAPTFVAGWQLPREPDLVLAMRDEPFQVPAEGEVRYQYFAVESGFTEDKWITGAEIVPGNRAVVHHVLVLAAPPGEERLAGGGGAHGFLAAYVPGLRAEAYPAGMAKRIRAGSRLIFQVHYTPTGSPQQDLSRIGFWFADPESITHEVLTSSAVNNRISIPPAVDDHQEEAKSSRAPLDVQLLSLMPHMHVRGKSFRYEAVFPEGEREVLLDVPRYDFNWQTVYRLTEPLKLPAGTQVHCVAHYDNSAGNLNNPDPTQTVRWGDQTWEEMLIGYFDIALPIDAAARAAASGEDAEQLAGRWVERIIERLDKDGDGLVAREEVPPNQQRLFDRLDGDNSGDLTPEELRGLAKLLRGAGNGRQAEESP
jgi:peroxiredoxin/mono/diheme cytochrome c family protein